MFFVARADLSVALIMINGIVWPENTRGLENHNESLSLNGRSWGWARGLILSEHSVLPTGNFLPILTEVDDP